MLCIEVLTRCRSMLACVQVLLCVTKSLLMASDIPERHEVFMGSGHMNRGHDLWPAKSSWPCGL